MKKNLFFLMTVIGVSVFSGCSKFAAESPASSTGAPTSAPVNVGALQTIAEAVSTSENTLAADLPLLPESSAERIALYEDTLKTSAHLISPYATKHVYVQLWYADTKHVYTLNGERDYDHGVYAAKELLPPAGSEPLTFACGTSRETIFYVPEGKTQSGELTYRHISESELIEMLFQYTSLSCFCAMTEGGELSFVIVEPPSEASPAPYPTTVSEKRMWFDLACYISEYTLKDIPAELPDVDEYVHIQLFCTPFENQYIACKGGPVQYFSTPIPTTPPSERRPMPYTMYTLDEDALFFINGDYTDPETGHSYSMYQGNVGDFREAIDRDVYWFCGIKDGKIRFAVQNSGA